METPYTFLPDLNALIGEIPEDSILSRTIYSDERLKVVLFGFAAGQELSEHTASQPAVLHFVRGEGELLLGADLHRVEPGAWVHMPPHLAHSVRAETPLVMLLLLLRG